MKTIFIFGNQLNGLEFVTYILIPTSMVLFILVYIFFNIKLLKLSFDLDLFFLKELEWVYKEKLKTLQKKIEEQEIVNEETKEKL